MVLPLACACARVDSLTPAQRWRILRAVVVFMCRMMLISRPGIQLSRRKRALLIGINYNTSEQQLRFSQRDAEKMRQLLKDSFGFHDEDIIALTDEVDNLLPPTWANIMQGVGQFIIRGQDNTDYVLFYSGHSGQHPEPDNDIRVKENGLRAFIVPVDCAIDMNREYLPHRVIYDKYLHESIIVPLEETKGCHLFAMLDCGHSATLLDLRHHRCNRIGTVTSAVRRALRQYIVEDVIIPFYKDVLRSAREDILVSIYDSFFRKETVQSSEADAPNPPLNLAMGKRCNGFCPRVPNLSRKSTVVCISACKDSEHTLEGDQFDTLTSAIVKLLQAKPQATLKDAMYIARGTVEQIRQYVRAEFSFLEAQSLMKIVKWNPQLASNDPLDINTMLVYSETTYI